MRATKEALPGIVAEVAAERARQDEKWGAPHDVPDGTGSDQLFFGFAFADLRDWIQGSVDVAADRGDSRMSWVLLEEVFEALAENDEQNLRAELIQVAAVAAKWVQIIDSRPGVGGGLAADADAPRSPEHVVRTCAGCGHSPHGVGMICWHEHCPCRGNGGQR